MHPSKENSISKQSYEVIDMMKLIYAAIGVGALVVMISIAPDIARYIKIRSM
jgi:hypothetical protein